MSLIAGLLLFMRRLDKQILVDIACVVLLSRFLTVFLLVCLFV